MYRPAMYNALCLVIGCSFLLKTAQTQQVFSNDVPWWWFATPTPPPFVPTTQPTPPPPVHTFNQFITQSSTPPHSFSHFPPRTAAPPTAQSPTFSRFQPQTRPTPASSRTAASRTNTKPPKVDADVFEEPNCFAQPDCPSHFKQKYAFVGGICNNPVDRNRGRSKRPYKRILAADYGDKAGEPRLARDGQPLPSARKISLQLNLNEQSRSRSISHMMPWWGQLITHETTKAPRGKKPSGATYDCSCETEDKRGCHNIPLERNDVRFTQLAEDCIQVDRTLHVPDSDCDSSIREQQNGVSSFLDAGSAYGDSESDFEQLLYRHSDIGELLTGNYADGGTEAGLPFLSQVHRDFGARVQCEVAIHKPPTKPCMLAGDTRANENTGLSAAHVVLLRKHNAIVKELSNINPHWGKDTLAREGKAIVTAIVQLVTFTEFLPTILGEKYMKRFNLNLMEKGYWYGYDASVDATLSNSFAAAAFRFGHTTLTKFMTRPAPDWHTAEADPLRIKESFFNNEPLIEQFQGGVNSLLRGLSKDATQLTGTKMVEDLREFLFAEEGKPGKDLFAINIQRGRDHGIPGYNSFRELCGLKRATSFSDMPDISTRLQNQLASLYKHVDDVDLYVGGLAETIIEGGAVGPTYACLIGYQYRDLKYGDKFWHENGGIFAKFSLEQLNSIRKYSLARLLCDVMSDLRSIQPKPMLLATVQGNRRKFCQEYETLNLGPWKENGEGGSKTERNTEPDTEWTVWLPCVTADGGERSVATTLNDALKFRPDDVCRDILSTETKVVNSITLVRFECPRGSLKKTDYPYIDSGFEVYWTTWKDNSSPSQSNGDDEEAEPDKDECSHPLAIQAQTLDGIPAGETGDVFEFFGTAYGLICRGGHQIANSCKDYRVRYLCRRQSIKKKDHTRKPASKTKSRTSENVKNREPKRVEDPNKLVWTPWSNLDSPSVEGDRELVSDIVGKTGFCKNPLYIDGRVVGTLTRARESGDLLDQMSHQVGLICLNSRQPSKSCKNYEVRYLCKQGDLNADTSTPPSVTAQTKEFCRNYGVCC